MSSLHGVTCQLESISATIARIDQASEPFLAGLPGHHLPSAANLLHYLAFRRHDLRDAQHVLATHGLSSLGRTESHVRSSLESVLNAVRLIAAAQYDAPLAPQRLSMSEGEALLTRHTDALLGPPPSGRSVRIMVTMPSEAATDYTLVRDLLTAGMDCMRINCAHDGPREWERMIAHLRRATAETGRACAVCMDIAGPKLRTGPIEPGPAVLRIKPRRDACGAVVAPAIVAIVPESSENRPAVRADAVLLVDGALPRSLASDTRLSVVDARGRHRTMRVFAQRGDVVLATLDRTAYLTSDSVLEFEHEDELQLRRVRHVPAQEQALTLRVGDLLLLTPESTLGHPATVAADGRVLVPAQIGVTLEQVFRDARPGEAIWFDDGRIGGVITTVALDRIVVTITQARPDGDKLREGKGVNLPDTQLHLGALTEKDLEDLAFVAAHADLVGYSFVRSVKDVEALQSCLHEFGGDHLGIILKIETRQAFEALPSLLLASMKTERFGVMIARGDLAIECGYERMAEVQEEILWIAEAAHAPVIWATQVLESLAKTGVPSRAEVTDAAMSERAECVMLNKGPFIRQAVRTLDDILRRMQAHQTKKRAMLRPLGVAQAVLAEALAEPAGAKASC